MSRFPFAYAHGWFRALYSDELAAGEVKPLRYMGATSSSSVTRPATPTCSTPTARIWAPTWAWGAR